MEKNSFFSNGFGGLKAYYHLYWGILQFETIYDALLAKTLHFFFSFVGKCNFMERFKLRFEYVCPMEFVNFLEPTEFSTVWWSKPHGMLYYIYRLCGSITQIRSYLWHDSIRQLLRKWPKSSRELLSNKSRGQLQPQTSLIDIIIDTTCWLWSLLLILLVFISRTWLFCTISNMRGGTFFDRPFRNRVYTL